MLAEKSPLKISIRFRDLRQEMTVWTVTVGREKFNACQVTAKFSNVKLGLTSRTLAFARGAAARVVPSAPPCTESQS